ncbi:hypothetical protein A0J61_10458, partial [Choanephora cucurbitarum]
NRFPRNKFEISFDYLGKHNVLPSHRRICPRVQMLVSMDSRIVQRDRVKKLLQVASAHLVVELKSAMEKGGRMKRG